DLTRCQREGSVVVPLENADFDRVLTGSSALGIPFRKVGALVNCAGTDADDCATEIVQSEGLRIPGGHQQRSTAFKVADEVDLLHSLLGNTDRSDDNVLFVRFERGYVLSERSDGDHRLNTHEACNSRDQVDIGADDGRVIGVVELEGRVSPVRSD